MKKHFNCIGIMGHPRYPTALTTHNMLWRWLTDRGYRVIIERDIADELLLRHVETGSLDDIGRLADLAIVIGGDGNMLGAARTLSRYNVKVIGINRGNLGFLTDLDPNNAQQQLADVLEGDYIAERRFILDVNVGKVGSPPLTASAVNEVVLHPGKIAHMIEFEVFIDDIFAYSQRADGFIVSTPTGSTAYSLSAGGPILAPSLNAIALVPMFPHTLSARPLVIDGNSTISVRFPSLHNPVEVNCDSQVAFVVQQNEHVLIRRSDYFLHLVHPKKYNYFNILGMKLGWSKKLF